jgi:hypothetical protein
MFVISSRTGEMSRSVILKDNGSVVNRVSPRKICVLEDGRMTETCSAIK